MMLSVGVRCLNEEELLPIFLANHQFADEIVVVDGGSTDRSEEIARRDPKVRWIEFPLRVPGKRGGWRNPEGKHVNKVIASCRGDWLWVTEMDAIPSEALQRDIRQIIADCSEPAIGTYLYYIAPWRGSYEHYPELIRGVGLTCWRRELELWADPTQDFDPIIRYDPGRPILALQPPYARVHLSWRTEEVLQAKWAFYRQVHGLDQPHPDEQFRREPLPEWLTWKGKQPYGTPVVL